LKILRFFMCIHVFNIQGKISKIPSKSDRSVYRTRFSVGPTCKNLSFRYLNGKLSNYRFEVTWPVSHRSVRRRSDASQLDGRTSYRKSQNLGDLGKSDKRSDARHHLLTDLTEIGKIVRRSYRTAKICVRRSYRSHRTCFVYASTCVTHVQACPPCFVLGNLEEVDKPSTSGHFGQQLLFLAISPVAKMTGHTKVRVARWPIHWEN
jgi:hypothetical protein